MSSSQAPLWETPGLWVLPYILLPYVCTYKRALMDSNWFRDADFFPKEPSLYQCSHLGFCHVIVLEWCLALPESHLMLCQSYLKNWIEPNCPLWVKKEREIAPEDDSLETSFMENFWSRQCSRHCWAWGGSSRGLRISEILFLGKDNALPIGFCLFFMQIIIKKRNVSSSVPGPPLFHYCSSPPGTSPLLGVRATCSSGRCLCPWHGGGN